MSKYKILCAMRDAMKKVVNSDNSSETAIGYIHYCEEYADETIAFLARMFCTRPDLRHRLIERISVEIDDRIIY